MPKGRFLLAVICHLQFCRRRPWLRLWPPLSRPKRDRRFRRFRTIPVVWTAQDMQWKIPLPGPGNGSPVIWKGRIFLQSTSKDGNERCWQHDAKRWLPQMVDTIKGKIFKKMHAKNAPRLPVAHGGFRPCLCGVLGRRKGLAEWLHPRGPKTLEPRSWPGSAASTARRSPITYGGKVYFNDDQDTKAVLHCFDGKTGDTVVVRYSPFLPGLLATPIFIPGHCPTAVAPS